MIEFERDPQQTIPAAAVRIIGLGGAGANMLDRVALDGMEGAELLALNTDVRTLAASVAREKIQLGENLTKGLGAGGDPELGRAATLEAEEAIRDALRGRRIVFLCVGLGGGTGSGGAPLVARMAREEGAFVVVFATMPFSFEGRRRHQQADEALNQLVVLANALVTFDNGRMGELVLAKQGVHEAFAAADRMISESIKAVIRLVIRPGLVNVGLDDLMSALRTTRSRCLFGSGVAEGKDRAVQALRGALASPLLDQGALLREAESVLVHVCGGENLTLYEIELMMQRLGKHVPASAHVLFGAAVDPTMKDAFSVTLISALPEERLHAPRDAGADEAAAAGTEAAAKPAAGAGLEPSEGFEMPAAASPPRRPEPPPAAPPPAPPAPPATAAPVPAAAAPVTVTPVAAEEEDFERLEDYVDEDAYRSLPGEEEDDDSDPFTELPPTDEADAQPDAGTAVFEKPEDLPFAETVEPVTDDDAFRGLAGEPAPDPTQPPGAPRKRPDPRGRFRRIPSQSELSFEGGPTGKFAGESPNVYEGENLDIPSFLRKRKG